MVQTIKKFNTKVLLKVCLAVLAVTPLLVTNSASLFLWHEPQAPDVFND